MPRSIVRAATVALLTATLAAICHAETTVPLTNPVFEDGFNGWQMSPPWLETIDNTVFHSGGASARLYKQSWGSYLWQVVPYTAAPGDKLTFSFWYRETGDNSVKWLGSELTLSTSSDMWNGSARVLDVGIPVLAPNPDWTHVQVTGVVPGSVAPGDYWLGVMLQTGGGNGGPYNGSAWIDDVRVTANAVPEPAFLQLAGLLALGGIGALRLRKRG